MAARVSGSPEHRLRAGRGLLLGLAAGAALALVASLGLLDSFDSRLFDTRYRVRGHQPAPDAVALVEVDDATVRAYDRWPLPRQAYAVSIHALQEGGAAAVGMDLLFVSRHANESLQDTLLVAVTEHNDGLVHAIGFLPRTSGYGGDLEMDSANDATLFGHGRPVSRQRFVKAAHASLPYPELLKAAEQVGHTALALDWDGVVRGLPPFVRYGDWAYPALSLQMVETAARHDTRLPQFETSEDGIWSRRAQQRRRIPTDGLGNARFVYLGDERVFRHRVSLLEFLRWVQDGDTAAVTAFARGRLVLIGATAQGEATADIGATPFSESTPLVYVHANAVSAALEDRFLTRPPRAALALVLLALGACLGLVFVRLHLGQSTLFAALAVIGFAVADQLLFVGADVDLPATAILLLPPLAWSVVEGARRRQSERLALTRGAELDVARAIQRRLLPSEPPAFAGLDVHGLYVPTEAVGGDYYDWLPLEGGRLAVVLGDVSGHGVPAALLMSHLRASFHAEASRSSAPSEIVAAMNLVLSHATRTGHFATFFLAIFEPDGGRFRCCNAGHNFPWLVHAGAARSLEANGIPIAMIDGFVWDESVGVMEPGDTLVIYSDGVPDWEHRREPFGDERWKAAVLAQAARGGSAREIAERLLADLEAFGRGVGSADDVTLVVVRALPR